MKNKKTIIFLMALILLIGGIFFVDNIYQNRNKINKTKKRKQNNLAIMIKEEGAADYTKSNSKDIPKGDYVLNEEKTHCENNGKILSYDNTTGKVKFSFLGSDRCYLYFDYYNEPRIGYDAILLDNGNGATTVDDAKLYIERKDIPDFSVDATENEGMYAAEDDLGTSYYFRGAVNNNWIKFGKDSSGNDMYWRIIRINGDGSIRMIYTGTTEPKKDSSVIESNGVYMTGRGTQIGTSTFNNSYDNPVYVGYMYKINLQHGNEIPSMIKTTVDNWYKTTTLETDLETKSVIVDQIFCNDRSASTSNTGTPGEINENMSTSKNYYYGARKRLRNIEPQLICPSASDKFTVNLNNGNGKLTYPVGLITVDEAVMAGGKITNWNNICSNTLYYLNTDYSYWTGSPRYFDSSTDVASYIYYISPIPIPDDFVNTDIGVRPVISLSSDVKLTGDGTWNNVYEVVN